MPRPRASPRFPSRATSARCRISPSAVWPLDTFAGASPVGANNIVSESGLRLRRLPLVFLLNGKMMPSLVLQSAAQFLGADLASSDVQVGRAIFLRSKDGKLLRTVPIDDQGRMLIRYREGPSASWQVSFDNILLYDDQLQHGIRPEQDPRAVRKHQVWIGRTDPAAHERFKTAVGQLSRVEVQLQAERTILDQDYVRPLPPMILAALYLLVAMAGAVAVVRFGFLHARGDARHPRLVLVRAAMLAFRFYNVILPLPSFAMILFGAYAVGTLAAFWDHRARGGHPPVAAGP